MEWGLLADYKCPDCHSHLRLLRVRKLFVCACGFVIGQEKRAEIAKKFRSTIPDLAPYMEQILAII